MARSLSPMSLLGGVWRSFSAWSRVSQFPLRTPRTESSLTRPMAAAVVGSGRLLSAHAGEHVRAKFGAGDRTHAAARGVEFG
jgi:hypothetical protein